MKHVDGASSHHDDAATAERGSAAGKRSRSESLPIQRRATTTTAATGGSDLASAWRGAEDPFGIHLIGGPVQRTAAAGGGADDVHEAAARGVNGAGSSLPYLDTIQRSFGRHDVGHIAAHSDPAARGAAEAIGARAYATGDHVAFAGAPDLHTAAHEAAHVVQQRAGVHLAGGVGAEGDVYEQHADAVADAVVQGRSAEALLDQTAGGGGRSSTAPVQLKKVTVAGGEFDDHGTDAYKPYYDQVKGKNGNFIERGAVMTSLTFTPRQDLTNASGEPAKEVSLVQTTNSTVVDVDNPHAEDQPESMLEDRRTDDHSAIDQQIFLGKETGITWKSAELLKAFKSMAGKGKQGKTNEELDALVTFFASGKGSTNGVVPKFGVQPVTITKKLDTIVQVEGGEIAAEITKGIAEVERLFYAQSKTMNLDPRYPEQRASTKEDLKPTGKLGKSSVPTTGWPAKREDTDGDWAGDAMLRDRPAHKVLEGHTLRGREVFETAAMADGNKMVGSIKWGWSIDGVDPQLAPAEIEKVDHGAASGEFFKAARKWNAMKVTDLDDRGTTHKPMQLPVGQSQLTWTDSKLDGDKRNVGGSFEEYRNILDALRRYQSVKGDLKLELKALALVKERCELQLERRKEEARNEAVKEVLADVERVVSLLA